MMEPLTPNTQAILLLTSPLIAGRGEATQDLLSLSEYNRLAQTLRDHQRSPADLIGPDAQNLIGQCEQVFGQERIERLLGRGFLLSQAVERWNARAIWVISRADSGYPKLLKKRLKGNAPPLLYGCGSTGLLNKGGLAVVGSRNVNDELIRFTENVGRLAAQAGLPIISGGAKGIDRAAMHGAMQEGGDVVGVMADSLERAALARDNREPLLEGRLVLISPYDPAAGFNVGNAMQRNKAIYALADAALVVTSDFEKGGTWAGAIEQLKKLQLVPVFVREGTNIGLGNAALIHHGARPWPNPETAADLRASIEGAVETAEAASTPTQETLSLEFREQPPAYASPVKPIAPVDGHKS
jgi:predicted Rossmann fold nucleotide-binding protein DprA/Smf involved in DNA uptake